ncbi:MAG: glycosyltransferase family 4 protein [Acidobacteriota bacterium]|nr:glycosyltransferase family 4 protein [Acidobacteriota bacterium]
MRILVAHNVPRARNGGMSRIMGFIHDEIAREGHEIDYLTNDDLPARSHGAVSRFAFPALVARQAMAAARAGRPYDILNVHEPSAAIAAALRRAGRLPPLVVTSHGLERRAWELAREERRLGRGGPSWRARLSYPATVLSQTRVALALADRVFVLNSDDAAYLARTTGRSPATIQRIWPGAADVFAAAAPSRDYARARNILFAATWRPNKGIADLVPAMHQVWSAFPDVVLTVLGAGVDLDPGAVFGVHAGKVRIVKAASDEEAARIHAASDIFVLPSLFEGTPLTLIEAMAGGLPVVTTSTCGMKDVIAHGRNGLLVPVRSPASISGALSSLLADPALRASLGRTAHRKAAERYTWPRVAKPVLEAYKLLV